MNKNDKQFINDLNRKISNITGKKKASDIEWIVLPDWTKELFNLNNNFKNGSK